MQINDGYDSMSQLKLFLTCGSSVVNRKIYVSLNEGSEKKNGCDVIMEINSKTKWPDYKEEDEVYL